LTTKSYLIDSRLFDNLVVAYFYGAPCSFQTMHSLQRCAEIR